MKLSFPRLDEVSQLETDNLPGKGSSVDIKGHLESSRIASGSIVTVPRLIPVTDKHSRQANPGAPGSAPSGSLGEWFQLRPRPRGSLGSLVPEAMPVEAARAALRPGEVLVAVQAIGLNFRDVLNVSYDNEDIINGNDSPIFLNIYVPYKLRFRAEYFSALPSLPPLNVYFGGYTTSICCRPVARWPCFPFLIHVGAWHVPW